MNILACSNCGVLLNAAALNFPPLELPDGTIDTDHAMWIDDRYVPTASCPVCSIPVPATHLP